MRVYNLHKFKERRQELRKNPTNAEKILWDKLRREELGYKFRRQHSIGGYILDFYCVTKRLAIELDGSIHNVRKQDDKVRDAYFAELGIKTLRFKNEEVEKRLNETLKIIQKKLL